MIKTIVPAGTYFLGDPCYAVPNSQWNNLLNSCDFFNESCIGTVTQNGIEYKVIGFNTAYGDGSYTGSDGVEYGVDAGLIGLTPIGLCTDEDFNSELGSVVTFDHPVVCTNDDGQMAFDGIFIDTTGDWFEDDSEYDRYDESDEE